MDKQYNHKEHEEKIYRMWEDSGKFSPSDDPNAKPFTIIMPPPNANDPLHVGHAMFVSIEDILTRYHRMNGRAALWLPGTDHAGIETQFVYEKRLKKEGKSRFNFDRETLYKNIMEYVQKNSDVAVEQLKRIGASADWERFKFMLDKDIVKIVLDTFVEMNKNELIYRDERLVNYCYKCGTSFSELEVNHEERHEKLYYVKYSIVGGGEDVVVATTRPETIYADTAIALHPDHPRAGELTGKKAVNPLNENELPIILDEVVDPEFGTGALKITPFHDQTDFEIWERHKDEMSDPIQVVEFSGKLSKEAGEFAGLKAHIAKPKVVEKLQKDNKIKGIKDHTHSVGICYRCSTVIEPLPLAQFFIRVKPLTKKVLEKIDAGEVRVHGAGHDKILRHWLENLKDWNVSRQIVWGIRMPVWYNVESHEKRVSVNFINKDGDQETGTLSQMLDKGYLIEEIDHKLQQITVPMYKTPENNIPYEIQVEKPNKDGVWIQETDTFDTWFSSAQWPFTTLKASRFEGDFDRFYPTDVMETGYDILPFWVMRMLMVGIYKTGETPFSDVYLHGLVRDEKGQKMSKSKGNVINPIDVIDSYGADSLRMALVMSTAAGKDSTTGESKIRGMRNLTNKIWNAARYVILSQETEGETLEKGKSDEIFYEGLNKTIKDVTDHIENYRIGLAAEEIYNKFWHWFCDECIEISKKGSLSSKALLSGLQTMLKLLHPFVPFVTEAVHGELKTLNLVDENMLMISSWPGEYENL